MQLHGNAKLTIKQRAEIRRLYQEEKRTVCSLVKEYQVSKKTIRKWIRRESPLEQTMPLEKRRSVVTEDYRQAVIAYRKQHPNHGKIRIRQALSSKYPQARPSHILRILRQAELLAVKPQREQWKKPLKQGTYRVQMDVQQLPAIEGHPGYEYKVSLIHLRTRLKYSEIHSAQTTGVMAEVLHRAQERLPPFF